jgi:hypothetical protein
MWFLKFNADNEGGERNGYAFFLGKSVWKVAGFRTFGGGVVGDGFFGVGSRLFPDLHRAARRRSGLWDKRLLGAISLFQCG